MAQSDTYRFGGYQLLEHIGSGSFGTVYKARPISSDPDDLVALKILRPIRAERHIPSGNDIGAVEKFKQEADRQSKVHSHENIASVDIVDSVSISELSDELLSCIEWAVPRGMNIDINEFSSGLKCALRNPSLAESHPVESCAIVDADEHDRPVADVHYIVSRYYERGNLDKGIDALTDGPHWSHDFALDIAIQIASGLKHIHDADPPIVHRDLKPENVLMDEEIPKIADFGISREINTGSGVAGTEGWSSPEQMIPGYLADPRSDIYSFGQLLFWILTNKKPFNEHDGSRLNQSVRDLLDDIKPAVSDVVERCRRLDISQRYGDCDELLAALHEARAIQNGQTAPQASTLVKPSGDGTLVLGRRPGGISSLLSRDYGLGLGFLLISVVILLADVLTGSEGWRWIEWAHWPIVALGVLICAASAAISKFKSLPTITAIVLSTALALGSWVQWGSSAGTQITIAPDESSLLVLGVIYVVVPA